jgi:hypothetical protein
MAPVKALDRRDTKFDNVKTKNIHFFFVLMQSPQMFSLARQKFTIRCYPRADANMLGKILVRLFLKYDFVGWQ